MKRIITVSIGATAALTLGACSPSAPQAEPAPTVTVTATPEPAPTVTVTATPEPSETAAEPEDEWLTVAREEHLFDLGAWYREYFEADCVAYEPECYDLFAEGVPLMNEYADWIRNESMDFPDYVPVFYSQDVNGAARALESWSYACPNAADCEDIALDAGSRSFEVITEANDWGE